MIAVMEKLEKEEFFREMRLIMTTEIRTIVHEGAHFVMNTEIRGIIRSEIQEIVPPMIAQALGVFGEDIDGKFALIIERFDGMNRRFERIENTLESHTEMIGYLMIELPIVKEDIVIIKEDIKEMQSSRRYLT